MPYKLFCDGCGVEIDKSDDVIGFGIHVNGIDMREGEKKYFSGKFHVCSRDCMFDIFTTGGVLEHEEGEWTTLHSNDDDATLPSLD